MKIFFCWPIRYRNYVAKILEKETESYKNRVLLLRIKMVDAPK
jgi:hypothetical protein